MTTKEPTKFDIYRSTLRNEFSGGIVKHLEKGFFQIDLPTITCTGSNVTQFFTIPIKHKIHQFIVKHTNATDVDSTNPLTYTLKYGFNQLKPNLLLTLKSISASAVTDAIHLFEAFWRNESRYQLVTNSTNTERLYVSFIVEIEDKPGEGD